MGSFKKVREITSSPYTDIVCLVVMTLVLGILMGATI
jgi:hypothetical protein